MPRKSSVRLAAQQIPLLLAFLVQAACSGGTDSTAPEIDPTAPVVRAGVRILPETGPGSIVSIAGASVTLVTPASPIAPGAVLVSGTGEGLLKRVVSVASSGTNTVVETEPADILDVFERASIKITRSLGQSNVAPVGAQLESGVRFSRLATNGLQVEPIQLSIEMTRSAFTLTGTVSFTLDIDSEIDIRGGALQTFKFVPRTVSTMTGALKIAIKDEVTEKVQLGRIPFRPIVVPVGIPPFVVPFVLTPEITIFALVDGTIEAGVEFTATAGATIGAGAAYQAASGFALVSELTGNGDATYVGGNVNASFTVGVVPIQGEVAVKFFGIVGPFVSLDAPRFELKGLVQVTPEKCTFDVITEGKFKATAGIKASFFTSRRGQSLADGFSGSAEWPFAGRTKTFSEDLRRISISNASPLLGENATLTAFGDDGRGGERIVNPICFRWQSSNNAIATVNAIGLVTAVAEGTVNITATEPISGKTATAAVTVRKVSPFSGVYVLTEPTVVENCGGGCREVITASTIRFNADGSFLGDYQLHSGDASELVRFGGTFSITGDDITLTFSRSLGETDDFFQNAKRLGDLVQMRYWTGVVLTYRKQ